ncbi:hypothetical protein F4861DRAFT_540591 [Xylaria intraflava]|nr:hypothetical protein F4861DRAFT_540591 [Xylaria intraflava]
MPPSHILVKRVGPFIFMHRMLALIAWVFMVFSDISRYQLDLGPSLSGTQQSIPPTPMNHKFHHTEGPNPHGGRRIPPGHRDENIFATQLSTIHLQHVHDFHAETFHMPVELPFEFK